MDKYLGMPTPGDIKSKLDSRDLNVLRIKDKIENLKKEISLLVKKDQDISKGEGYRNKLKDGGKTIELEILKKEDEIRSLQEEAVIFTKKKEMAGLKEEIKKLEKEYKDRITGISGFRDATLGKDPIEEKILEKEARIKAIEVEINGGKKESGVKKEDTIKDGKKRSNLNENSEDDFVYAGANEGFGKKDDFDRLTESGTEGHVKIQDSESIPKDEKPERLTGAGTEGIVEIADSENIPKDEKNKFVEVEDAGFKKEPINRDNIEDAEFTEIKDDTQNTLPENASERSRRLSELEKEIAIARREYLEVDYQKNSALSRVRKYFGGIGKQQEGQNLEQDQEIAWYRAHYDNKLFDLQKLKLEEASEKGASNEELANLMLAFRREQKITLADEHDNLKIEQNKNKVLNPQKMVAVAKWYKALPTSLKLGIGVAMMAGGAAAAGIGGAAVGTFATLATMRRIFGGMTAGVGATLAMEARGQAKDKRNLEAERVAFLKSLENLSSEEKYKLLSNQIKNIAIKDGENSINKIKNQDIRQATVGAMLGAFLGSGAAGHYAGKLFHSMQDLFGDSAENLKEVKNALTSEKILPIHGSVEKTLIEELRANGVKNPGAEAHRMVLQFMKEKGIEEPNLVHANNNLSVVSDGKGKFILKAIGGEGHWGHREVISSLADKTPEPEFETATIPLDDGRIDFNLRHEEGVLVGEPQAHEVINEGPSTSEVITEQSVETITSTEAFQSDLRISMRQSLNFFREGGHNLAIENANLECEKAMVDDRLGPKLKVFVNFNLGIFNDNVRLHHGSYVPNFRPNNGEVVKHYVQRVVMRTTESKYGILRG